MIRPTECGAAFAVRPTDDAPEPRVIQQFTSIFLVSRCGELWRVYDSATTNGTDRAMPSPTSTLPFRLFLALARKTEVRVHAFTPAESREISARSLQQQLDRSGPL